MRTIVCVGICKMDSEQAYCVGCNRTLLEIEQWRDYSEEQRKAIALELPTRTITDQSNNFEEI